MYRSIQLLFVAALLVPGCTTDGPSNDETNTNQQTDAGADDATDDDATDSGDTDDTSLGSCEFDPPISLGVVDQGFGSGYALCSELGDNQVEDATVVSVSQSELVVDIGREENPTFQEWNGPALDGLFSADESVDLVLPACGSSWSIIRGEGGAVATFDATLSQGWLQAEDIPSTEILSSAPTLRLEPQCRRGSRFYNELVATGSADEVVTLTQPGQEEDVGEFGIYFGGSKYCCRSTDGGGGEPPGTNSLVNLWREN